MQRGGESNRVQLALNCAHGTACSSRLTSACFTVVPDYQSKLHICCSIRRAAAFLTRSVHLRQEWKMKKARAVFAYHPLFAAISGILGLGCAATSLAGTIPV